MTTHLDPYQQQLLVALRMRDVPGPAIAQALAEVESHVADTGEDPRSAFGEPKTYAAELAQALGMGRPTSWWATFKLRWQTNVAAGVLGMAGGALLTNGLLDLAKGERGPLGMPSALEAILGVVVIGGLFGWLQRTTQANADRVLDPRTGADMAGPLPRWVYVVFIASMCTMPLIGVVIAKV